MLTDDEVVNPAYSKGGNDNRTILVYRLWSIEKCNMADESLALYKKHVEGWCRDMRQYINTYDLNRPGTQQALQCVLTIDWGRVRGNCPVIGDPPKPLPYDSYGKE